jgi:hypothetical protein
MAGQRKKDTAGQDTGVRDKLDRTPHARKWVRTPRNKTKTSSAQGAGRTGHSGACNRLAGTQADRTQEVRTQLARTQKIKVQ